MLQRIWAVMRKEFILTLRDRRTLAIMLSIPVLQLFLFGYAMNVTVDHIATVVADQSLDSASRAYIEGLTASGYFDVVAYVPSQAEAIRAIDEGRAKVAVIIPLGFGAGIERGEAQAQILVDGTDVLTSQSAYSAAMTVAQDYTAELLVSRVQRSGRLGAVPRLLPLDARFRILYNPNLSSIWFVIPSMAAALLQTQSISLSAAAVVREREEGTMEQILVTPIRPFELLLGKLVPNVLIALINMLTVVALGMFWFDVPFRGSVGLFMLLSFVYVLCGLGLGLLISTVSHTQFQAQQWVGLALLLGVILGGFIFPRDGMPLIPRIIGNLFPLTYFIPVARGIITKGVGLVAIWPHVASMVVYMVAVMVLASLAFRQGLE